MAETPQQTWPPTGRVRFLGFTQDGEAMPTFQDLDYKGRQAIRTHEGSGLPDLTSPDVFRITQAAARRLYGESYEQQGRADAGAGLHPWLVDRVTAEAARERAEDSRVGGAARQHTEAVAALRRGDQGAWKRLPPAPSQADADRLARLFADQPNESGIHVAPAFRMANRFDMPLGRGSEMTITSGGADRIDRDR